MDERAVRGIANGTSSYCWCLNLEHFVYIRIYVNMKRA